MSAGRFDLLMQDRVKAVLHERLYLLDAIEKNNLADKVVLHPYVINNEPVYFMFSRKSVPMEDIELINKSLGEIKRSTYYKELYDL